MARRLLLSYLGLIVVTVALLALIVRLATVQTFSRYLSDQSAAHSDMLPVMLAGHYASHGTWEGVQPDIDEASALIGAQVTLADDQGHIVATTRRDLIGQMAGNDLGQSIPVLGSGGATVGTAYVGRSLAQQRADEAFLANVTRALVVAGLVVALLAAGLGVLLARSIGHPMAEMGRAAERIAQGDYAVRVPLRGRDEVTALAQAFNQMAEGMSNVEQLRQELVANVSHDLRTPLTVIRGYLEGLHSGQIADRRSAEMAFAAMQGKVSRLLRLVDDLRQVDDLDAETPSLERHPTDVADLARDALARVEPLAAAQGVALVKGAPSDLPMVSVDPNRLGQALFNLLDNAVRYTPPGGTITLTAGCDGRPPHVWLAVQDTGEGIPPEHLPHVFERLYRTDPARSQAAGGAGLGLAIVRAIVKAHGGRVNAESDGVPGQGSIFTIRIPIL
jgi:two-component system sensor histidine kinase BaeS